MKKLIATLAVFLGIFYGGEATAQHAIQVPQTTTSTVEVSSSSMNSVEREVRAAAVRVMSPFGHGSGSVIKYRDMHLVLTAQHVADGTIGTTYVVQKNSTIVPGILIYSDPLHDIAVLWLGDNFSGIKAMDYRPTSRVSSVGTQITYSGYPSFHNLMTYRGRVAGYEFMRDRGQQIMLHTYAYFGSSGSVIYDSRGKIVGILWGVDVDNRRGAVVEDMVWVSPIQNLDIRLAIAGLCESLDNRYRACRR
jgi:hypothetical protein